jgi:ubiquinone/menaquinone biosynthesis C-methylase UbiE
MIYYGNDIGRRRWQNPEHILTSVEVREGSTFIDVGCGDGFFAIPAAKLVGGGGKVYGIDINRDAINRLQRRASQENLNNLEVIVGNAEETVLCDACGDFVFFGINLHDFTDQRKVLDTARKMLKPTGKLVNLDWKKEPMTLGPPYHIRFSKDEATHLIEEADFHVNEVRDVSPYHYIIIAHQ